MRGTRTHRGSGNVFVHMDLRKTPGPCRVLAHQRSTFRSNVRYGTVRRLLPSVKQKYADCTSEARRDPTLTAEAAVGRHREPGRGAGAREPLDELDRSAGRVGCREARAGEDDGMQPAAQQAAIR